LSELEEHTLSNPIPDIPAFDMLVGQATMSPYRDFGDIARDSQELEREQRAEAVKMRQEVRSSFGVKLESASSIPTELDDVIEEMWETGWDPRGGNLNLFTRTFGLLLTDATLELLGGRQIFRPPVDSVYIHESILWPGVEAFPYHKAFKCLTHSDGETMAYFVRGVGSALQEKGLLSAATKDRLPRLRYGPRRE
jgi:hypothetical protein